MMWLVPDLPLYLEVLEHMAPSDLIKHNILTIPKFPEHVCMTAGEGLPDLPSSGPK